MIPSDLMDRARAVRIEAEIARHGIKLRGRIEREGPCPRCGGMDRFSINVAKQTWHCRGCKPDHIKGNVIGFAQWIDGVSFETAVRSLAGETRHGVERPPRVAEHKPAAADDYERRQHAKAAWSWRRRRPIEGTPAERYLRAVRGITCALPATLGYLPTSKPEHHHAVIAAFALAEELEPGILGEPLRVRSVHLTLLKPDGSDKADIARPRRIVGRPLGRPIVLAAPNDLGGLAATESIEDGLSVFEATGLGVWAAGSAGMMPGLAASVPDYIEAITIFAHNDKSGRDGARDLAAALASRLEVNIEGLS
jgi:hypothetical protein